MQEKYLVKSQQSKKQYEVCLGSKTEFPSCECEDWSRTAFPCKHIFAILKHVEGLTWDSLSPVYRVSPYINLDEHIVPTLDVHNYVFTEVTMPQVSPKIKRSESANVDNVFKHQQLCREQLKEIINMTYTICDPVILEDINTILKVKLDQLHKIFPATLTTRSKNVSKRKSTESIPSSCRPLKKRRKKHPSSGRCGQRASTLKDTYLVNLPVEEKPNVSNFNNNESSKLDWLYRPHSFSVYFFVRNQI